MTNKTYKILIVDDEEPNRNLLSRFLSCDQYTLFTAENGIDALERAKSISPDLVLLDVSMPVMDGYEVCRALKADEATKKIPVIFVTAMQKTADEASGFESGAVDYITKPINAAVVQARVRAHLSLKEAQDAADDWNSNLKKRLLQSIATIREKTQALMSAEERASGSHGYVLAAELLSGAFELMEDRHGVHARAVSELAGDAARKMNLDADTVAKIRLAGLMHDVGTLGSMRGLSVKHEIDMSANELEEFHTHPVRGEALFESFEGMQDVGQMVRGHHEALDGNGFPDGLKEDAIPLGARLIAIADFIENAANSVSGECAEYALMKARLHAGTLLDPKLIPYFSSITRILYFKGKRSGTTGEVEVPTNELISGMQLSRDLSNEAGVLLFQKGDKLDLAGISLIRRTISMSQSSEAGIWVYFNNTE
ncbi:MAG: response regulator [Geobacteraceae bacterium]|nr:response regulator [Geobacteraceae bacterium]